MCLQCYNYGLIIYKYFRYIQGTRKEKKSKKNLEEWPKAQMGLIQGHLTCRPLSPDMSELLLVHVNTCTDLSKPVQKEV